jgi:hypothetical protein
MIPNTTTKTLEIKLAAPKTTNHLEWTFDGVDLDAAFKLSALVSNDGVTNDTTAVTVCAAPAAGHSRDPKRLTVYNADTVDADVIVQLNNNGTIRRLWRETLAPGKSLFYVS